MNTLPRGLFRVTGWTFACGIVTTLLQMVFVPMALGQWYIDHLAQMNMAFNALALVLFIAVGLLVMRRLTYKMIFLSAAVHVALSLIIIAVEQISGVSPVLVFVFALYPFLYFSSSLSSTILTLHPGLPSMTVALLTLLVSFLFVLFGRRAAPAAGEDAAGT